MLETAIRRRYPVDATKAAETVNKHLSDADARVSLRAAGIAALMEGQNQKDEHHRAIIELERIRDQLTALLSQSVAGSIEVDATRQEGVDEPRIGSK